MFRLTINDDMDNPIIIASAKDFPTFLDEFRDSLFALLTGKNFHQSQLVLNSDGDLTTYDFYSEAAWFVAQANMKEERSKGSVVNIYRFYDIVERHPVYVGQTKKSVQTRVQGHINRALQPTGPDQLYGFLRQRIEEKKFPTIQVVKSVPADAAKYEEGAEIRRLLQQGVPLFNREAIQPTTRARLLMDEVYLPIEDAQ